jgi:hypothetical protein
MDETTTMKAITVTRSCKTNHNHRLAYKFDVECYMFTQRSLVPQTPRSLRLLNWANIVLSQTVSLPFTLLHVIKAS